MTLVNDRVINDRVIDLWQRWVTASPGRQRRYYEFHNTIIRFDPALCRLSLARTLEILAEHEPLRPRAVPSNVKPATVPADGQFDNVASSL